MSTPTAWEAFEDALALAEVGAWTWDPGSGDMQWSNHLYDLLGRDHDAAAPSLDRLIECLHADDRDRIRQAIQDVSAQNAATEVECRYVSHNAEGTRWMRMKIVPETDDTTPVQRVVGTVRDITSRKRAEAQLGRLRELGCRYAQGYLFARPMPAAAFEEFFEEKTPFPSF